MLDPWPESPYSILVARAREYDLCQVWPVDFQRPSPVFPVPLSKPDPDISLNLQSMIDSIYARSRYERSIDYRKPVTHPFDPAGSRWLEQRSQAGRVSR